MLDVVNKTLVERMPGIDTVRQLLGLESTDTSLDSVIEAAIAHCEQQTGYSLNHYRYMILATPVKEEGIGSYVALPFPPVREVDKVEARIGATYRELESSEYNLAHVGTTLVVVEAFGISALRVTYETGFETVPAELLAQVVRAAQSYITDYSMPAPLPIKFVSRYLERHL